jgi:5-methylcytosine-specific restriction endonuclease McrA
MLARDGNKCLKCGTSNGLSPSHVYPTGRYRNMAWILDNIKPLCWACHRFWWHLNPTESGEWFKKKFPTRYRRLKKLSQQYLPKPDLLKIKAEYEKVIATYE